jgi:hypothetical protein
MWIRKGKLCGGTLKAYQVQEKPTLDNIFKLYIVIVIWNVCVINLIILKGCEKFYL